MAPIPGDGVVYDSVDNRLFTGPGPAGDMGVLNATTGRMIGVTHAYVPYEWMTFDAAHDLVLVAGGSGVTVINGSTLQVVAKYIPVGNGTWAITVDVQDDRAYVAARYDNEIWAIDLRNYTTIRPAISVYSSPYALLYDPVGDKVFVSVQDHRVLALNGSTGTWDSSINWTVGGGAYSMALVPAQNLLYVANYGPSNVTAINATSGVTVAQGIMVGPSPEDIVFYPPTRSMVVSTGGSVYSINVTTNNVTAGETVEPGAYQLAYDSADGLVYVDAGHPIGVYTGTYLAVVNPQVSLQTRDIQLYYFLERSVYDPADQNTYVLDPTGPNGTGGFTGVNWTPKGASSVLVVNGTTRQFQSYSYSVGTDAEAIAYDGVNGRLYVADQVGNAVSVIDPANRSVGTINMTAGFKPVAVAVDTQRNIVYVAGVGGGNLTLINATTGSIVPSSIYVGTAPCNCSMAEIYDSQSDTVFVGNCGTNNVTVVNASSRTASAPLRSGWCPDAFAIDPKNGSVWVANGGSNNVSVLNGGTGAVLGSVWVGNYPNSIVYDPANGLMYVAIGGSDNVTPIDPTTLHFVGHGIWLYAGGPSNIGPLGLSYDPVTQEVDVPTAYGNEMLTIGNVPGPVLNVTSNRTDINVPVEFLTNVTGGTAPFSYAYSGLPPGCTSQDSSTLYCWPVSTGNYTVVVTVVDARNFTEESRAELQVFNPPSATSLTISPTTTDTNEPVWFAVRASSGASPLSVSYQGLPTGCASTNLSEFTCMPSTPGLYTVTAVVTDAVGVSQSVAATLQVVSGPQVSSFLAFPSQVLLGESTVLLVAAQGGVGPYSYSYSGLPASCPSANTSALTCSPLTNGPFNVTVTVSDAQGEAANATTTFTTYWYGPPPLPPAPGVGLFLASPPDLILGNSTTFYLTVTGGEAPLTVSFANLPPGCSATNSTAMELACTPNGTGNYTVTVQVRDALGRSANGSTMVFVGAVPTASAISPPASPSPWPWVALSGLVGGLAGFGSAVVTLSWFRSRSKGKGPGPTPNITSDQRQR